MPSTDTVGRRIRDARRKKGLTDRALSEATGIHITLIRRYEKDEISVGSKNGPKLSRVLDMNLADLF